MSGVIRRTHPLRLFAAMLSIAWVGAAHAADRDCTEWSSGVGNWTDATHWSQGVPNPYQRTEVHGESEITISPGTYLAGDLEVGLKAGDHSRVIIDGAQLILMQDSLRIGELTGGEGEFVLKNGAMHCFMDVYVGAANGVPSRATKASLRIQGGSFLGRTLLAGVGWGAESMVAIEGSHASAVHVLDYANLEAHADADGRPGDTTLECTLDEHGVTPITIQARYRGLQIIKDADSHCRLRIALCAVPPREDITLVSSHVPIRGTFDELPEGSEITADYAGQTYRWQLTYRGGPQGHDLVLLNKSQYAAEAPVTHGRPLPEIPKALWTEHRLYTLDSRTHGEPAFPGAEGFGSWTPGGRDGKTIYVENLDDSGPGSLRAAIETTGSRTILFHVGGVIPLKSTLVITEPFLTIDGQSAPARALCCATTASKSGRTMSFCGTFASASAMTMCIWTSPRLGRHMKAVPVSTRYTLSKARKTALPTICR